MFPSVLAIVCGNVLVWLVVLSWRAPYLPQIPVFDLDVATSTANMWARSWWVEGGPRIWFALPYSPRSVENPVLESRRLYQSLPPGAFVPIYAVAHLLGREPSVPMINWINTVSHGVMALCLSLTAFVLARSSLQNDLSSVALALAVPVPVLVPKGLVYVFSQMYGFTTQGLVFIAAFILLATVHLASESERTRNAIFPALLLVAFWSLLVDWYPYMVYAWWLLTVEVGRRLKLVPPLGRIRTEIAVLLPVFTIGLYLFWRIFTPGSLGRTLDVAASMYELAWKLLFRMGQTDDHPFRGAFLPFLRGLHDDYFWTWAFPLLLAVSVLTGAALAAAFVLSRQDPAERKRVFAALGILLLTLVPTYAQLYILKQHAAIHRDAISKVAIPFALVPFVLLPVAACLLGRALRRRYGTFERPWMARARLAALWVPAVVGVALCAQTTAQGPVLAGRVDGRSFAMWDAVRAMTRYEDVVFSPDLEVLPMSIPIGVANKLVYRVSTVLQIDQKVRWICEPFNVVVVSKSRRALTPFAAREPTEAFSTAGLHFLRFARYPGGSHCPSADRR